MTLQPLRDLANRWRIPLIPSGASAGHYAGFESASRVCADELTAALDAITPTPDPRAADTDACGRPWKDAFKNFHRSLCARFGYVHDEKDWQRDQVSLEECIAAQVAGMVADHDADLTTAYMAGSASRLDEIRAKDAEIERLRKVIDAAARVWAEFDLGLAWEGAIDNALLAACVEVKRLRNEVEAEKALRISYEGAIRAAAENYLNLKAERDALRAQLAEVRSRLGNRETELRADKAGHIHWHEEAGRLKAERDAMEKKLGTAEMGRSDAEHERDTALARVKVAEGLLREARTDVSCMADHWHCSGVLLSRIDGFLSTPAAPGMVPQESGREAVPPYGHCPKCGSHGVTRERRHDGNDTCSNGHVYPSSKAETGRERGEGVKS